MSIDISKLQCVKRGPGGQITARCPVCAKEGRDKSGTHLSILPDGRFNCIVGSAEDPSHNREIRAILRGYLTDDERAEVVYIEPRLDIQQTYPESTLSKLLPQYDYWIGRGASPEVVAMLGGGLASNEERGKLAGRFVFPCRDASGQLIGFAGRLVNENSYGPKWKILGSKKAFIFPYSSLSEQAIDTQSQVILVEGIGCVLALAQIGIWNTMCLFGLSISSAQVSYLIGKGIKRIIISTNNETSGIGNRAADKLAARLSSFFGDINIYLPNAKDFMDMTEEKRREWLTNIQK